MFASWHSLPWEVRYEFKCPLLMGVYSRPWSVKEGDVWLPPPVLKHWMFSPSWRLSQARDNSQKARPLQPPFLTEKVVNLYWHAPCTLVKLQQGRRIAPEAISRDCFSCLGEWLEDELQNPISKHQWCNRINLWTYGVRWRFLASDS